MRVRKLLQKVSMCIFAILFLVVVAVHTPDRAEAKTLYKGQDGGLSWTISDKGKLVIKGSGDYVGYDYQDYLWGEGLGDDSEMAPEWTKYPAVVTSAVVKVTNLKNMDHFFRGLENLNSVDVRDSDLSKVTSMRYTFSECGFKSVDLAGWDTHCVQSMEGLFEGCDWLTTVDLSGIDVSSVTDVSSMFSFCSSLKSVNLSCFANAQAVGMLRDMKEMFFACIYLESVDLNALDVSHVKDMSNLFKDCEALKDVHVESWDTGSVETMEGMFYFCSSLRGLDLNSWDTSSCRNMRDLFRECESLEVLLLDAWDTGMVTDMAHLFEGCNSLEVVDVHGWDTGNVKELEAMFTGCKCITEMDLSGWDISSLQSADGMFYDCSSLREVNLSGWEVFRLTDTAGMFRDCTSLERVDMSGWDLKNCKYMSGMFSNCSNLRELTPLMIYNANVFFTFENCSVLNTELTILGKISSYEECFQGTSVAEGAMTVVNYGGNCSEELCDQIIATKNRKGHVEKGGLNYASAFASVVVVKDGIKLTWKDMEYADRLVIEKSLDDGTNFVLLNEPKGTGKGSLLDKDVKNGKRYFYRIRSFAGDVEFGYVPEYTVYLTPVTLDPSQVSTNMWGDVLFMKSSKNKKADLYFGYVKRDGSYVPQWYEYEPKIGYDGPLVNGKKYTFKVAPAVWDTFIGWYSRTEDDIIIGPRSEATDYYHLDIPALSKVTKRSDKKFRVEWKKNSKATGYHVQVADNKKMTNAKSYRIKDKSTVKKDITKADGNKKYYVRVRSYKVVGKKTWYSMWSGVKKF